MQTCPTCGKFAEPEANTTGNDVLFVNLKVGDRINSEVTMTQLSGHHEQFKGQEFAVIEGEILETLKTALFMALDGFRGPTNQDPYTRAWSTSKP
jgi:hypothetical protein